MERLQSLAENCRPALVLSPAAYNGKVGLALLCPITSQVAPIFFGGKFVGAAGVDIAVNDFVRPEAMKLEEILQRGFIFLDERGKVEYWSARTRALLAGLTAQRGPPALQ